VRAYHKKRGISRSEEEKVTIPPKATEKNRIVMHIKNFTLLILCILLATARLQAQDNNNPCARIESIDRMFYNKKR